MKEKLHRRNGFWLVASLALMLVSAIGASLVQTDAGKITVKEMYWETSTGVGLSALLLKPDAATAEAKAPAVIVSHGRYNNKEMQNANFVELAKRGYVVVSIDMYGHGDSDYTTLETNLTSGTGMYDAVKLVAALPYVDTSRIGVTGHSAGAFAVSYSVAIDNQAPTRLISAALLVDNDPTYRDEDGAFINAFEDRDAGIIAAQYDEFFFRTVGEDGKPTNAPRDFITTPNAQSFLHYGTDPAGTDERVAGEVYTDGENGAMRVIYTPAETHPWSHFSSTSVAYAVDFFEEALGAPNPIASSSQTWQVREAFTGLGLVGFAIFLVAFTRALLRTRAFAGLAIRPQPEVGPATRRGLGWFWGGLAVSVLLSAASFVWVTTNPEISSIGFFGAPPLFPQGPPFFIGVWAAINGVLGLIILAISYQFYGKRNGQSLQAAGVLPGWRTVLRSLLLAVIVVASAFGIVFVLHYFFTTDFRVWVLAIRTFESDKLLIALAYLPFFLLYFVVNSILINGFNRITLRGKEWINTAVLAVSNALGPIIVIAIQYAVFFSTGLPVQGLGAFSAMYVIWLFPVVVILIVTAIISRKIYRVTGNPYIAGFINAMVATLISVSNSLTMAA